MPSSRVPKTVRYSDKHKVVLAPSKDGKSLTRQGFETKDKIPFKGGQTTRSAKTPYTKKMAQAELKFSQDKEYGSPANRKAGSYALNYYKNNSK
jgi:hypothetical protein